MSTNTAGASAPTTLELEVVDFHGDTLYVVEHNQEPYAPIRGIIENLGLDWSAQYSKLNHNRKRFSVVKIATQVPGDPQSRQTICIPVRKLPSFLSGINPNKVKNELRAKIIAYQNECDDALWNYWTSGHAVNPRQASQPVPRLGNLAEQFAQATLALNAPELSDHERWQLARQISVALFGVESAYLLGQQEVTAYQNNLRARLTRKENSPSLAIIELGENGLELSYYAYTYFVDCVCTIESGLAASEDGLYQTFCRWFQTSFDHPAPHIELFKTMLSSHHRRISLAGKPWYLGLAPRLRSKEVQA